MKTNPAGFAHGISPEDSPRQTRLYNLAEGFKLKASSFKL
jgi:hypothetical protein